MGRRPVLLYKVYIFCTFFPYSVLVALHTMQNYQPPKIALINTIAQSSAVDETTTRPSLDIWVLYILEQVTVPKLL
jgi:hypothetical protein